MDAHIIIIYDNRLKDLIMDTYGFVDNALFILCFDVKKQIFFVSTEFGTLELEHHLILDDTLRTYLK